MSRRLLSILLAAVTAVIIHAADPPASKPGPVPAGKSVPPGHAADMAASRVLFAEKIRPLLTSECLDCHGGAKTKSGFSLANRELLLQGGDNGVAVLPGKAKQSRLIKMVAHEIDPHMPPKKTLPKESVALLTRWVDLGAAYDKPLNDVAEGKKAMVVTDKDRQYWAYRPLQKPPVPAVKDVNWCRNPVDAFILNKLEATGIPPVGDASKRTLIRRVTFDLTGLPPTVEEVDAFLHDDSPTAYEKVVDRLLASTAYGERWARHWLDPARYAESHGFEHDYYRPFAYHYRDFVIKAFNSDMPYDQFIRWQIAGDEVAPNDPLALAATGFLGAGVFPTQITNSEAERIRYDAMDDMLSTTGHAVLALTVGCARCHDHKYDPIPSRDYYRLLSAFTNTVRAEIEVDLGTPEEIAAYKAFEAKFQPIQAEQKRIEEKELPGLLKKWIEEQKANKASAPKIADGNANKGVNALWEGKSEFAKLPKAQKEAVVRWYAPQIPEWKAQDAKRAELEKQRSALKNTRTKIQATTEGAKPMRHHTADGAIPDFYPQTYFLKRGDPLQKDGVASLGFLQVLSRAPESRWLTAKPKGATTEFRRVGLAKWLLDTDTGAGALAARVMVNRLWHHHFGRGIVATLNDFGFQGDHPSHPELLEFLANDLVSHDWKLKRLQKMLVMTRTYQLDDAESKIGHERDPDNKLRWHNTRRRLEGEAIRDSLLAVGGVLDRTMYGAGTLDEGMRRRSIYFEVKRSQLIPMLQVFDWPDTLTSGSARTTTTVAPQALLFLNNPHVREYATSFGNRLKPELARSPEAAVRRGYEIAFSRLPTDSETADGVAFLASRGEKGLAEFALVLMSLNEFIYIN